jgi:hypothetical protein
VGLRGLGLAAAFLLVLGVSAAGAVPPSGVTATHDRGRPVVTWTNPPGTTEIRVVFSRQPNRVGLIGTISLGAPTQSTMVRYPFSRGTYYATVGTISCADCQFEWSESVKFVIPPWKVTPGRGIANVDVGSPKQLVQDLIGNRPNIRWSSTTNYTQYSYNSKQLYFAFLGDLKRHRVVHHMGTSDPKMLVGQSRIHVGSTEKALRAALKTRCRNYFFINYTFRECWLGRRAKGAVITIFTITRGRISSIELGKVRYLKGSVFLGTHA